MLKYLISMHTNHTDVHSTQTIQTAHKPYKLTSVQYSRQMLKYLISVHASISLINITVTYADECKLEIR